MSCHTPGSPSIPRGPGGPGGPAAPLGPRGPGFPRSPSVNENTLKQYSNISGRRRECNINIRRDIGASMS